MTPSRRPSGYLRRMAHRQPHTHDWLAYESAKAKYIAEHPEATPSAYEHEMKRIAKELNI
ncbi:MAG: hypothetical protein U1A72_12675 [Sulfuritalea sp.]|nr:hypothetical protein [Sulfuritalea sp.]